jgi:hypothetical protein
MTRIIKTRGSGGMRHAAYDIFGWRCRPPNGKVFVIGFLFLFFISGCDKGLEPEMQRTGFGGTIHFLSSWPPVDSVIDMRVVAVPYYPVDTLTSQLIGKIQSGVIPYSVTSLPLSGDSGMAVRYEMFVPPARYYYVAVVQQYGLNVFQDWRVVGVYTNSASAGPPYSVDVLQDVFADSVTINVDFKHLPLQPFKP